MKWAKYPLPWKMLWFLPRSVQPRIVRITDARQFYMWLRVVERDDIWLSYRLTRIMVDDLGIR